MSEMEFAANKADNDEIKFIPLVLRDHILDEVPTDKYRPLMFNNRPILNAPNLDSAFVDVIEQLKPVFEKIKFSN
jgi:hypothetical protein